MNTTVIKRRLYLADLEVTAKDVYIKQDFANKTAETLDMSGHHEIGRRQNNGYLLLERHTCFMVQQIVLPIKDSNVLKMVQDTLLDSFRAGRRNYTIFQVGKATLLRVSDVMTLKKSDVYNPDGSVKNTAFIHDKKTGKANTLYLKPVHNLDISAFCSEVNKLDYFYSVT